MFLSRESDYAVRIISCLNNTGGERRSVGFICAQEDIPKQFAYKILKKMEHAHIVKSSRGPQGGYELDVSLKNISLFDVISAIEGPVCVSECIKCNYSCSRNTGTHPCKIRLELVQIQHTLAAALKEKSIAEILS